MDVRSSTALPSPLSRTEDAVRTTRPAEVQKPGAARSMDDARAAARAAFAKVVAPPTRIDAAQRLAEARQASPDKPLPRGSLIDMVV
jgi:hypothetical protein